MLQGSPINLKKQAEEATAAKPAAAAEPSTAAADALPAASLDAAAAAVSGSGARAELVRSDSAAPEAGQGAPQGRKQGWQWWPLGRQAAGGAGQPQQSG